MSDSLMRDILVAVNAARKSSPARITVRVSKSVLRRICDTLQQPNPLDAPPEYAEFAEREVNGQPVMSIFGATFVFDRLLADGEWKIE